MNNKVLIIGNTSENLHIGSIFVRAVQKKNLPLAICDINIKTYAPSMQNVWGKVFFKIAGKRPLEWWSFNSETVEFIKKISPKLVIVTGIFPLEDRVFRTCNQTGTKIVNYLTDSPWSKQNYHRIFRSNLKKYDCIFSTKKALIPDLIKVRAKQVHFLPFAFDSFLHHHLSIAEIENESSLETDVCLIGGADTERISFINDFLLKFKGRLGLYGTYWDKDKKLKQYSQGIILGDAFCKVVGSSKINIGLVRRANKDGHSMRSFEIAACGGVGIYEDTPEHREIFKGYPEYGFFNSPDDLAEKCNWLLEHSVELEQMRQLGIEIIVKDSNTYEARLKTILEWVNKNESSNKLSPKTL